MFRRNVAPERSMVPVVHRITLVAALLLPANLVATSASELPAMPPRTSAQQAGERVDLLTFAAGAVPISLGGSGQTLGIGFDKVLRAVDGNPGGFTLALLPGTAQTDFEFVFELPAPTVFDRFAVPNVLETPSPSATFTRLVEVHGSATSASDGYTRLASATLTTHRTRGEVTELEVHAKPSVRWVKLRLAGGIQVPLPQVYLEFSEIIANGTQETPALSTAFNGVWAGRAARIELRQDGPVVTGCYDRGGELTGTVSGNILRATGIAQVNRIPSTFILGVAPDGSLRGVRSTNGGPFTYIQSESDAAGVQPECPRPPAESLGCGSVIHGINFDFDSAVIRPESEPVLERLYRGLSGNTDDRIVVEGHTSSEGEADYNLRLSQRRAQSVIQSLIGRGLPAARLEAAGVGEVRPIARNDDESGRAMNRRVEVHCR
jgi:outer membrane protein OmpA-like peptidoglycan-associated protein